MTDAPATARVRTLAPAMRSPEPPTWSGAAWVGAVDRIGLDAVDTVVLAGWAGHERARLLVRDGREVAGYVDVAVDPDGTIPALRLVGATAALPATQGPASTAPASTAPASTAPATAPASARPGRTAPRPSAHPGDALRMSVVIGTRERPDDLRDAIASVLASTHPDFELIVADNAPTSTRTRDVAESFDDARVRYVLEPRAGVSRARNAGVRVATGHAVAFVDDDVVVDEHWLSAIADAYARDADVACVTGLVPSGELRTPTQRFFDGRVTWGRNLDRRVFRTAEPPADLPLFPFSVGAFGTGANMSLRRDVALAIGGFDPALGPGTPSRAGEDPDVFTRVLLAGHGLAIEPAAIAWHRHRPDTAALRAQALGYGSGLGAWVAKLVTRPSVAVAVARRAPGALRRLGALGQDGVGSDPRLPVARPGGSGDPAADPAFVEATRGLKRVELTAVLGGPLRYLRGRLAR